jgi:hypothetical protein
MSGASSNLESLSTKATVSPTIAHLGSVLITLVYEALRQGAVLIDKLTVFEHPIMQHAFIHRNVSSLRGPYL